MLAAMRPRENEVMKRKNPKRASKVIQPVEEEIEEERMESDVSEQEVEEEETMDMPPADILSELVGDIMAPGTSTQPQVVRAKTSVPKTKSNTPTSMNATPTENTRATTPSLLATPKYATQTAVATQPAFATQPAVTTPVTAKYLNCHLPVSQSIQLFKDILIK